MDLISIEKQSQQQLEQVSVTADIPLFSEETISSCFDIVVHFISIFLPFSLMCLLIECGRVTHTPVGRILRSGRVHAFDPLFFSF